LLAVLIASAFFTSFAWSTVSRAVSNGFGIGGQQVASAQPTVTSAVDHRPTFPTPSGGKGTNDSSQPPASAPVTFPPDTPTVNPTPGNGTGQLQIISIPQTVNNNSTVSVVV